MQECVTVIQVTWHTSFPNCKLL